MSIEPGDTLQKQRGNLLLVLGLLKGSAQAHGGHIEGCHAPAACQPQLARDLEQGLLNAGSKL